ncbi:MAG: hypothetical protein ACK47M_00245 [Caldilinea sp.]
MPEIYHIRIKGHLDPDWATEFFDGLSLRHLEDGITLLHGPLADQAALHGILACIRDLGLPLLSIQQDDTKEGNDE